MSLWWLALVFDGLCILNFWGMRGVVWYIWLCIVWKVLSFKRVFQIKYEGSCVSSLSAKFTYRRDCYCQFQMAVWNQLLVISVSLSGCLAQLKLPADVELTLFSPMVSWFQTLCRSTNAVSSNIIGCKRYVSWGCCDNRIFDDQVDAFSCEGRQYG